MLDVRSPYVAGRSPAAPPSSPMSPRFQIDPVDSTKPPMSPMPQKLDPPVRSPNNRRRFAEPKTTADDNNTDRKHTTRPLSRLEFDPDLHTVAGARAAFGTYRDVVRVCTDPLCKTCVAAVYLMAAATTNNRRSTSIAAPPPKPVRPLSVNQKPVGGRRTAHPLYATASAGDFAAAFSADRSVSTESVVSPSVTTNSSSQTGSERSVSKSKSVSSKSAGRRDVAARRYATSDAATLQAALASSSPETTTTVAEPTATVTIDIDQNRPDPLAGPQAAKLAASGVYDVVESNKPTISSKPKPEWTIGGVTELTEPRALATAESLLERTGSFQPGVPPSYVPPLSKTSRILNAVFSSTAAAVLVSFQIAVAAVLVAVCTVDPV